MKNNRIRVFVEGVRGNWAAKFAIHNQYFTVAEVKSKVEAEWYCKMLRHAFKKLKFK